MEIIRIYPESIGFNREALQIVFGDNGGANNNKYNYIALALMADTNGILTASCSALRKQLGQSITQFGELLEFLEKSGCASFTWKDTPDGDTIIIQFFTELKR